MEKVCIPCSVLDSWVFDLKHPEYLYRYIDLLRRVSTVEQAVLTRYGLVPVHAGEVVISYGELAKSWGCPRSTALHYVQRLIGVGFLTEVEDGEKQVSHFRFVNNCHK